MIDEIQQFLKGISIGIRYRPHFSIEDKLGSVIDSILYAKNSYFNPTMFPRILSNPTERRLYNEKNANYLSISAGSIVLEINLSQDATPDVLPDIIRHFGHDIINGIMKEYSITGINRIGIVKRYIFEDKDLIKTFICKATEHTLEDVSDILLRFSRKYPIEEAIVKKNVNDYHNAIYTILKRGDQDEMFVSIDYQRYYDPSLETPSQVNLSDFITRVESYNSLTFPKWLQNYHEMSDAKTV